MTEISTEAKTSAEGIQYSVDFTFIESGNQLQTAFIGLHPALLVEPQVDPDLPNEVVFVVTGVDLDPKSLLEILEVLKEGAEEALRQQVEMGLVDEEQSDFELANLPETPEG